MIAMRLISSITSMAVKLLSISILLFIISCSDRDAAEQHVREIMRQQEIAWNSGDIDRFMEGYSDTICFMGSRGLTCGREEVAANYKKSYPDPDTMGELKFQITEIVPVGNGNAWVTGGWTLFRSADTLQGGYSLLWTREREGWRIVRDHSY